MFLDMKRLRDGEVVFLAFCGRSVIHSKMACASEASSVYITYIKSPPQLHSACFTTRLVLTAYLTSVGQPDPVKSARHLAGSGLFLSIQIQEPLFHDRNLEISMILQIFIQTRNVNLFSHIKTSWCIIQVILCRS